MLAAVHQTIVSFSNQNRRVPWLKTRTAVAKDVDSRKIANQSVLSVDQSGFGRGAQA
jgi:hypothetical protein